MVICRGEGDGGGDLQLLLKGRRRGGTRVSGEEGVLVWKKSGGSVGSDRSWIICACADFISVRLQGVRRKSQKAGRGRMIYVSHVYLVLWFRCLS